MSCPFTDPDPEPDCLAEHRRWRFVSEAWRPGKQATNASTISRWLYEERLVVFEDEVYSRAPKPPPAAVPGSDVQARPAVPGQMWLPLLCLKNTFKDESSRASTVPVALTLV